MVIDLFSRPDLKLFGTSGIRGRLGRELSPALARRMGLSFANYLNQEGTIVVGMDLRPASAVLYKHLVEGAVEGGLSTLLAGQVPTPALLHFQQEVKASGAVMVTGSHTIPAITGLLFFKADGGEADHDMESALEHLYLKGNPEPAPEGGRVESVDALAAYRERILRLIGKKVAGSRLAFDPGNGSMSHVAASILSDAGARIIAVNDKPDGTFPDRSPYPRKETLGLLSKTTLRTKSDFGVGTDGDGDRAIFVDERGKVMMGDVSGALFADRALSGRKGSIVAPLNSSNLIEYICRKHNARLVVTKVGPPAIVSAIRENSDAVFGFEETGKYIWPETLLYGDSVYSTASMCELLSSSYSSLGQLVDYLPRYFMEKRMLRCKEESKVRMLEIAYNACKLSFPPGASISTMDGIKVTLSDGSWILLRPSGTEPYFRCYAESFSRKNAVSLVRKGMLLLREVQLES